MLTPEELLKPRYKVIADYPNSSDKVGSVYTLDHEGQSVFYDKYPHLFRPLSWWEERAESDLPEYVKVNKDTRGLLDLETFGQYLKEGTIIKVRRWFGTSPFYTHKEFVLACYVDPATEDEYNQYVESRE